MDIRYELNGDLFVWNAEKAEKNWRKHGVRFEEAASVFADPLFVLLDASRKESCGMLPSASISEGACSTWCTLRSRSRSSASFLRAARNQKRSVAMLTDRLKKRLTKDRPMTTITLRIPVDVVASLKEIAPHKGFSGYQTLLKSYISEGLRQDETKFSSSPSARLIEALKKRGVPEALLDEAARELETA